MSLIEAKVAAYLIDRALILPSTEVDSVIDETPKFARGRTLKDFNVLNAQQLRFISRLFHTDTSFSQFLRGYRGTGVEKGESGEYKIVIYGDEQSCPIISRTLSHLGDIIRDFQIVCEQIDYAEFASTKTLIRCGECIRQPSGTGSGTMGAWLKRKNPNGKPVGFTNNHVAVEFNKYQIGTEIFNNRNLKVGEVEFYEDLIPNKPPNIYDNYVDLALISPDDSISLDYCLGLRSSLTEIAPPTGDVDLEEKYDENNPEVYLCRKNEILSGSIIGIMNPFYLNTSADQYRFVDVIVIDVGEQGDSGAMVIDQNRKIGGVFFAVGWKQRRKVGYVNKWEWVCHYSKVDINY